MEFFKGNKLNFLNGGFSYSNLGFKFVIYVVNDRDITVSVPSFMFIMTEFIDTIKTKYS